MIIAEDAKTATFNNTSEDTGAIRLLDSNTLVGNNRDTRIAILRKVQYRNTKDGKPFIRANFEDINGYIIIGRMFDFTDINTVGSFLNSLTGSLVQITYNTDYFNGSVYLSLLEIKAFPTSLVAKYAGYFVGKYNMAEKRLKQCNTYLACRNFSEQLETYRTTYCNLTALLNMSDETVQKGLRGAVIDIVYQTLIACNVSNEAILAFLTVVLAWFYTRQEIDSYTDENTMFFTASLAEKVLKCKSQGLLILSNKISELTSLFSGTAHTISADTYLLYNIYKAFVEASNIAVLESHLPGDGFCTYKSYTVRRS